MGTHLLFVKFALLFQPITAPSHFLKKNFKFDDSFPILLVRYIDEEAK
jgi:hypothetical protein